MFDLHPGILIFIGGMITLCLLFVFAKVSSKSIPSEEEEIVEGAAKEETNSNSPKTHPDYELVKTASEILKVIEGIAVVYHNVFSNDLLFMYDGRLYYGEITAYTRHDLDEILGYKNVSRWENNYYAKSAREKARSHAFAVEIIYCEDYLIDLHRFDDNSIRYCDMDPSLIAKAPSQLKHLDSLKNTLAALRNLKTSYLPTSNTTGVAVDEMEFVDIDGNLQPLIKVYQDDTWIDCGLRGPIVYGCGEGALSTMLYDQKRYNWKDVVDSTGLDRCLDCFEFDQQQIPDVASSDVDGMILNLKKELDRQLKEIGIFDLKNNPQTPTLESATTRSPNPHEGSSYGGMRL